MNVGVLMDLRNPMPWRRPWPAVYRAALELCEQIEDLGGHSVWLSEHHLFEDGYLPQPLTIAAAIAARTKRLRIGTAILIAPFYQPAQLVEAAALVDQLSEGRLDLGLGAGYRKPEFDLFNQQVARPIDQLFQRVDEMRELLRQGHITPPPAQDPFPVWIGCNGPRGARRVGLIGERLLSLQPGVIEPYRSGLAEGGHDSAAAHMSGPVSLFLSDDPERDWPVVSTYFCYQMDSYRAESVKGTDKAPPPPVNAEAFRARGLPAGLAGTLIETPNNAAAQLRHEFGDLPVETIIVPGWLPGIPDSLVHRHIELLCTELAPLLR
jgi:alkanesulfonate monooxygenase SsuD/methylene tetrahydromethanopterin reductase-like flavin-dependent oxidoreductase (luciferase family)